MVELQEVLDHLRHGRKYGDIMDLCRIEVIQFALEAATGNIIDAARLLGVHRNQMYNLINTLGVEYDGPFTKRGGKVSALEFRSRARANNRGNTRDGQGGGNKDTKNDQGYGLGGPATGRRSELRGTGSHSEHAGGIEGRGKLYGNRKASILPEGRKGKTARI